MNINVIGEYNGRSICGIAFSRSKLEDAKHYASRRATKIGIKDNKRNLLHVFN